MGKKTVGPKKDEGASGHIEINLDSEEKADVLDLFMKSYKCVSNEELRKRLKTDDDEEEQSAEPFL